MTDRETMEHTFDVIRARFDGQDRQAALDADRIVALERALNQDRQAQLIRELQEENAILRSRAECSRIDLEYARQGIDREIVIQAERIAQLDAACNAMRERGDHECAERDRTIARLAAELVERNRTVDYERDLVDRLRAHLLDRHRCAYSTSDYPTNTAWCGNPGHEAEPVLESNEHPEDCACADCQEHAIMDRYGDWEHLCYCSGCRAARDRFYAQR